MIPESNAQRLVAILEALHTYPRGAMVRFHKWPNEEEVRVDVLLYSAINPNFETRDGTGAMIRLESDEGDAAIQKIAEFSQAVVAALGGKDVDESGSV